MNGDRKPLPKFWYFPRGEKAVVVMTGDDHANNGTAGRFDIYKSEQPGRTATSTTGSACAARRTSTRTRRSATRRRPRYVAQGFEIAVHVTTGLRRLHAVSRSQSNLRERSGRVRERSSRACRRRRTNRTHCIAWSDYDTQPQVALGQRHPARHELLLLAGLVGARPSRVHDRLRHADAVREGSTAP